MFAGVVIGLAIIAMVTALRAGLPGWAGLIVAMIAFSNDPTDGPGALAAGSAVWIVLRQLLRSRA